MGSVSCNGIILVDKLDKLFTEFDIFLKNGFESSWNLSFALLTCHGSGEDCQCLVAISTKQQLENSLDFHHND